MPQFWQRNYRHCLLLVLWFIPHSLVAMGRQPFYSTYFFQCPSFITGFQHQGSTGWHRLRHTNSWPFGLHPFVSRLTRFWMALMFSMLSQSMVRWWPSVIVHPWLLRGCRTMLFLSASRHISLIQHDLFQWRHKASVDGIIWFSRVLERCFGGYQWAKYCVGAVGHGRTSRTWSEKPLSWYQTWGMFLEVSGSN